LLVVGTMGGEPMPAERVSMRLYERSCASNTSVARSIGIARSTVAFTLARVAAAKRHWLLPTARTDRVPKAIMCAPAGPQGLHHRARNRFGHVFIASYAGPAPH
jgi:hypothetical protein